MSLWRQLVRGVRVLVRRKQADRDVADEVQHYFDETVSALLAKGMSPADARRAAHLLLGSPALARTA